MTARLFRCTLSNAGGAMITRVDDHLDHGEWADESLPSVTAQSIAPGATGHYQAESGGDIPIFDSLMTGTEGSVLFTTTDSAGAMEWFRITHRLPYWSPSTGVWYEAWRYDPRIVIGPGAFDTRDLSPANMRIRRIAQFSPHDVMAEIQSYPWLIVWSVGQIFTQPYGDFHWHLHIEISNTAPPASTTIPFSAVPPPEFVLQPFRFSRPELWRGIWEADGNRVTAVISVLPTGLLQVSVTERTPGGGPQQTIEVPEMPISRLRALQIRELRREMLLEPDDRGPQLMFEAERLHGYRRLASTLIGPENLDRPAFESIDSLGLVDRLPRPQELRGDYLELPNGAVLEFCRVIADGQTVGYALRYIRPAAYPLIVSGAVEEVLYRRLVLN